MTSRTARVLLAALLLPLTLAGPVSADLQRVFFEAPTYRTGTIHGQDGWTSAGAYDEGIIVNDNIPGWGAQSFRISNNTASANVADQTFSKPVVNEAGETDARSDGWSGGTRVRRFDARFEFTAAFDSIQSGLAIEVSPDRGDGTRMGILRIADEPLGISLTWREYKSGHAVPGCATSNFRTTTVLTGLNRLAVHDIRLVMDFREGPANDVVQIYVNDRHHFTGTTWEDFYRECVGGGSRTVDSLLFRTGQPACSPSCANRGFLFDNLDLRSVGVVLATGNGLSVTEGGAPDTYTVRLETQPNNFVQIDLSAGPGISVTPARLTFTATNYNLPQTVTVQAIDDGVPELPTTTTIQHFAASFDGTFDGTPVDTVTVEILDNDGPFVIEETDGITVASEAGAFDRYTMRLLSQPSADVTVTASPDAQVSVAPSTLTFTPANWASPQEVRVHAVDDAVIEGTHTGTVTHAASSSDPTYGGVAIRNVVTTIYDNDPADVTPPPPPVIANCPSSPISSTSYTLAGTAEAGSAVEITINSSVFGSVPSDAGGGWSIPLTFPTNGTYSVTAVAVDGSGNRSAASSACSITVAADITPPPAPTIATPAEGAYTGAIVTVGGSASADTVLVRLYDTGFEIAQIPASGGTWSITRTFATGGHVLTARAQDAAGNLGPVSATRRFIADGDAPTLRITQPPVGGVVQPVLPLASFRFRGTASDALSGMGRVEVVYEDLVTGELTTRNAVCNGCPAAGGAEVTWTDDPNLLPGVYQAIVRAIDRAGNVATDGRVLLFVD